MAGFSFSGQLSSANAIWPYVRSGWHGLSVGGDLRTQYTPWSNPPPSGEPGYSYLKCQTLCGATPLQFVFHNNSDAVSSGEFSFAFITEDVALYPPKEETTPPPPPYGPPEWTDADFSPLRIVPGGFVSVQQSVPTPPPITPEQTLVMRVKLQGAPLWVQSLSMRDVEGY